MQPNKELTLHLLKIKDQTNNILQSLMTEFNSPVNGTMQCLAAEHWQNSLGQCGEFVVITNVHPDDQAFHTALTNKLQASGLGHIEIQTMAPHV
jgi:hypothetical protein